MLRVHHLLIELSRHFLNRANDKAFFQVKDSDVETTRHLFWMVRNEMRGMDLDSGLMLVLHDLFNRYNDWVKGSPGKEQFKLDCQTFAKEVLALIDMIDYELVEDDDPLDDYSI